ncbi:hypothetical protein Tco_0189372 [Tanacetum coccineum]
MRIMCPLLVRVSLKEELYWILKTRRSFGSRSVEAEGESSFNSLREKKKRLENELAAVSGVPLSDVRSVRACVLETFAKTSDVNVIIGSRVVTDGVCGTLCEHQHQPIASSLQIARDRDLREYLSPVTCPSNIMLFDSTDRMCFNKEGCGTEETS